MRRLKLRRVVGAGILSLGCALAWSARGGGSGRNVIVVINQASSNSVELANYFCERRAVPPENVLRINWPGTNTAWTSSDFHSYLLAPLLDMIAGRQLTNQADHVVLSMDIPFQTINGSTVNSTTSALFYGLRSDSGDPGVTNSYCASEGIFSQAKPASAPGYSFLATMITADSLAQAERLVDQGVGSDGKIPIQPVVLAKSPDPSRNIRYTLFDNAIFNVNVLGVSSILRTNTDSLWTGTNFLGYETGLPNFTVPAGAFVPGAIADSLSSFGGIIFGPNSQTSLLAMIYAGAAGSYGTVAEPGTDPQKFPDPQVYFYQARGFGLAESYYQSINIPYLGLMVAEPLAAPFQQIASGRWSSPATNVPLSGTAQLSVRFTAADTNHPLQQIDLFVDGKYFNTLTNLNPRPGNLLEVEFGGYPITYTVPANATLASVATGLADAINPPQNTSATKLLAFPHGDRIELHSLSTNLLAEPYFFDDAAPTNSGRTYRVSYLPNSYPPRLVPLPPDPNGHFRMQVEVPASFPYVVQASTNLENWLPITTNSSVGLFNFTDPYALNFPHRFYRVVGPTPDQPPVLSARLDTNGPSFIVHVDNTPAQPWSMLVSSNLVDWTSVFTNQLGGPFDFADSTVATTPNRLFRAQLLPPSPPVPAVVGGTTGITIVRVDNATRPFTVDVSTNNDQWSSVVTNFLIGQPQTTVAGSALGAADLLSTFLTASRSTFLDSQAFGLQQYAVIRNSLAANAWVQLTITKTNGSSIVVALTNLTAGASSTNFARQFYDLLNATPGLQGADGLVAQDFSSLANATFNLRPRSPGLAAAAIKAVLSKYAVFITASTSGPLTQNLSDLQPRNHLYLSTGLPSLAATFQFDTTALADGYHDLTAVAFEGTHVHSQSSVTVPVQITNSPLNATLTLLDLTNMAPVQGSYHVQVAANTNSVSAIRLYTTGGLFDTVTNQSTNTFTVDGGVLGAGLHPFWAVIETTNGLRYRTQVQRVRLANGQ